MKNNKSNQISLIKDVPILDKETSKIAEFQIKEKAEKYGTDTLSNIELLSLLLKSTKSESSLSLSTKLLKNNIRGLEQMNISELEEVVGELQAIKVLAAIELGKRLHTYKSMNSCKVNSPKDVFDLLGEEMRYLTQEHLKLICLNVQNIVESVNDIFIGSLNSSVAHPREVFAKAIEKHAASIIVCHNHPSGDPAPSSEDINITKRLKESGRIIGIDLLDHIIIGDGNYISLKEKGLI